MTLTGFLMICFSAICHATWNYATKKVKSDSTFIWLFSVVSSVIYAPLALVFLYLNKIDFKPVFILFILGSVILHSIYFILLNKGYSVGNLSIIYPLARGTGPLFSTIIAIIFLKENASVAAILGILLIICGIITITGNPSLVFKAGKDKSLTFAFLCGISIASYTIFDKIAVSAIMLPPLILDWLSNLGRAILLTPYAIGRKEEVKKLITYHKKEALTVGILSPLSYILVLTAMVTIPVYYIAPIRELSILIGAFLGVKFLSEELTKIKTLGICLMTIGIITLSLA